MKSTCKCDECDNIWRPMCYGNYYFTWSEYPHACTECPWGDDCMKKSTKVPPGYKYEDLKDFQ